MNYDQIVRELKKLGIEVEESRHGGSSSLSVKFNRKNSEIDGRMDLEFVLNGPMRFYSTIYETEKGKVHHINVQPNNQTEFFNIIRELKITNKKLLLIRNMKNIKEAEKEVEKLTKQFKDVRFRLGERKLWLKYLKGKIDNKERKETLRKLVIQRDK